MIFSIFLVFKSPLLRAECLDHREVMNHKLNLCKTMFEHVKLRTKQSMLESMTVCYAKYLWHGAASRIDDYAKDGGEELFTKMHCVL